MPPMSSGSLTLIVGLLLRGALGRRHVRGEVDRLPEGVLVLLLVLDLELVERDAVGREFVPSKKRPGLNES